MAISWTPRRIKALRKRLDVNQTVFGLALYDYPPETAQRQVSRLENGERDPTAAVRRTLDRIDAGEITVED